MTLRIKIDPIDQLASRITRLLAKGKCQRCLRPTSYERLQAAHFIGRANKKVRYDFARNICALCFGCHQYLDSHALEKVEFFRKRLGDKEFEKLKQTAYWRGSKLDKAMVKIFLENKLREVENELSLL